MNVPEAIGVVRVVRDFAPDPVTDTDLRTIANAGRRAGSSKNLQRWAFVLVRDRERLRRLAEAGPYAHHIAGAAAAIALVTPDPKAADAPLSIMFDLGRAAQNMVLTAWNLGIGSCPATVYDPAVPRAVLGLPVDHHCEYILSFGRPADPTLLTAATTRGGRASLDEVIHQEQW